MGLDLCLTGPRHHVEWIEGGHRPAGAKNLPNRGGSLPQRELRRALAAGPIADPLSWSRPPTKESNMLVLSRKKNESIIINDDITIVVVEIRGDKVRLGVEAPKEIPVHRNEVYEAIRRNQVQSKAPAVEPDATSAAD